jgi:hypothetical protein
MSKLAFVREKQSGLSKEVFEEVLRLFSFISYFEEKFVFTSSYLDEKLFQIKERKKNIQFDNEKVIQDLQVAIGILNKEGLEFTFPHRSLQEFFAAEYIANLNSSNKKLIFEKLISKIKNEPHVLLDNGNFYSLLKELDNNNFIRYIALPSLSSIEQKLKTLPIADFYEQYNCYGEIILFYRSVLQDVDKFKQFINEEERIPYMFIRFPKGKVKNDDFFATIERHVLPDNKEGNGEQLKNMIKKKCGEFLEIIPVIYKELEEKLKEDEESDTEIINLI